MEVDFENAKTTLIIGDNGSGKSTLLDALCYVLYGRPFRKITIPQLKNSINKKGMLVEVEFMSGKDEYVVRRGLAPNIFEVEKNGELVNQDAANKDYQDILTKYVIKMNQKAFCQVVILGSASFVPFMQLPAGHRREILEDLLDIQIFTTMNLLLKDKVASNTKDLLEVDYKLDLAKEKIRMHEEHVEKLLSNSQEVIDELEEKIGKYESDIAKEEKIIEEKRNSLSALIDQTADYDKLHTKLGSIHKIETQMHDRIERLTNEAAFFENHDNCPTCKQIIDEAFKASMIGEKNSSIVEVNSGLLAINSKAQLLESQLASIKIIMEQISSINVDISIKTNKTKSIRNSVADLREQISKINKKSEAYANDDQTLKSLEAELHSISEEKKELFEVKEVHKVVASILKDTGIKAKIIKQYVPIINKLINKYLAAMDFFVQFELDENFNETIKSRFRDAFSYSSFSEGEKSKIDLALLFTWRTIARLRNSASTNILILDEVFDGSLDAGSSEELLKILIELSNDSNVLVISHRTDQLLDKFDRVIRFEKKANFSRMAIEEKRELA